MHNGFFDLGISITPKKSKPKFKDCTDCGLCKRCDHPQMGVKGQGKKGILIVGEFPSGRDDRRGRYFSGEDGEYLWKAASELGLNIERDCYIINAIRCHPYAKNQKDKVKAIKKATAICRHKLHKTIDTLKPAVIIPLGEVAIDTLIGDRISGRMKGTKRAAFFGASIPDQHFKSWVCPTYSPEFLGSLSHADDHYGLFLDHLSEAWRLSSYPVTKPYTRTKVTQDQDKAIGWLRDAAEAESMVAFDYETTGIKPHKEGHRIVCASIAFDGIGYAFPFFDTKAWKIAWKEFLTNKKIKTIAHNLGFESIWTYVRSGMDYWPTNYGWDTCLGAHCVANHEPTSLKFQTYTKLGVLGFDDDVDCFITKTAPGQDKKSMNSFNKIDECPLSVLLKYNAFDSLYTLQLQELQEKRLNAKQRRGFKLFMEGAISLAKVQQRGMNIDIVQLTKNIRRLEGKLEVIKEMILELDVVKDYKKVLDIDSNTQLATFFYDHLKLRVPPEGRKVDEKALARFRIPVVTLLLKYRKTSKIKDTFLAQFKREQWDSVIHPSFSLNRVKTFRGCIRKGTNILCNDAYNEYPNGKPIELIVPGDYVYSFDDDLKLCLKKVTWAAKTGHMELIRVHFNRGRGKKGYIDLTPEHKVRNINGDYIKACDLLQDFRSDPTDPTQKYQPKSRVLSCERFDERLYATGNQETMEHRFVYEQFTDGILKDTDVIHHKDHNHYNNEYSNLHKYTSLSAHSKHHVDGTLNRPEVRAKNIEVVKRLHREGHYTYPKGKANGNYVDLSEEECLKLLHEAKGSIVAVPYDFATFKSKCKHYSIDIKTIKMMYNKEGIHLTAELILESLSNLGRNTTQDTLKISYRTLSKLMAYYGITYERAHKNQNGFEVKQRAFINNHVITHIEYLDITDDVYDIEVEGTHNFIASGICVHNSSSDPNFQNLPKHDKIANEAVRGTIMPDKGCKLNEYDYKSIEVTVGTTYHKDPNMIAYLNDPSTNFHTDTACDLFCRTLEDYTKVERQLAKNKMVFPQFYGSSAKPHGNQTVGVITRDLWEGAPKETIDHLKASGITTIEAFQDHVVKVEDILWNERFPVYNKWREQEWRRYRKKGYLDLYTGFRVYGPLSYTQVINIRTQGTAFHCLLYTLTRVAERIEAISGRSYVIGQIHDALIVNVHPEDEAEVDSIIKYFGTQRLAETYPELRGIPLSLDKSSTPIDGSWFSMEEIGPI